MTFKRILPNLLTLFAIVLAIVAIIHYKMIYFATFVIVINAFIDGFDGYYARRFGVVSSIGHYLDFTNDVLSFLVLPMLIVSTLITPIYVLLFLVVALFYFVAGVYRLMRENKKQSVACFTGIPTTLTALLLMIIVFFYQQLLIDYVYGIPILLIMILCLSILMICRFPVKRLGQKKSC